MERTKERTSRRRNAGVVSNSPQGNVRSSEAKLGTVTHRAPDICHTPCISSGRQRYSRHYFTQLVHYRDLHLVPCSFADIFISSSL